MALLVHNGKIVKWSNDQGEEHPLATANNRLREEMTRAVAERRAFFVSWKLFQAYRDWYARWREKYG